MLLSTVCVKKSISYVIRRSFRIQVTHIEKEENNFKYLDIFTPPKVEICMQKQSYKPSRWSLTQELLVCGLTEEAKCVAKKTKNCQRSSYKSQIPADTMHILRTSCVLS